MATIDLDILHIKFYRVLQKNLYMGNCVTYTVSHKKLKLSMYGKEDV